MIPRPLADRAVIGLVLLVATVTDLRRRQVPLGLSLGFLASGLAIGALRGPGGRAASLLGLAVGMLPQEQPPMKHIAYYRVSTDRQGKSGLGLDAQRATVTHHLNGRGQLAAE